VTNNFRYTNGQRPFTRTPGIAAFKPKDSTIVRDEQVVRVGRRVELADGKVDGYDVTWLDGSAPNAGAPPSTDHVANVGADGVVGGNVNLTDGRAFLNPAGRTPLNVIETFGATISFNTNLCWYLDSTFCSYFHMLKNVEGYSAAMVLLVLQVILFSIFSLAALIDGFQLFRILSVTACHGGGCLDKFKKVLDEISKCGIVGLTVRLLCLWTPPIAYAYLFIPCWDCFDFEGAATHEVGHVLGLSHPDTAADEVCLNENGRTYCNPKGGQNSFATSLNGLTQSGNYKPVRMNRTTCELPWSTVQEFPEPDEARAYGWSLDSTTGVRDTIMEAFTQHNPSVCLTFDDLEALNINYPQCEYAISVPVCYKTEYYIGWIRLGVWVGCPIILMLVAIMLLSAVVRKHHIKRMDSIQTLVKEKSRDLRGARGQAQRASCEAAQLAEALDMQIATEESRIQERANRMSIQMVNQHLEQLQVEHSKDNSGCSGTSPTASALGRSGSTLSRIQRNASAAAAHLTSPQGSQGGSQGAQGAATTASSGCTVGLSAANRGSSFLRRGNSGIARGGSGQPAGERKWLGASGKVAGSMKKMGSALGIQRGGPATEPDQGGESTSKVIDDREGNVPSNREISVPDQYRLNPIRGSEADPENSQSVSVGVADESQSRSTFPDRADLAEIEISQEDDTDAAGAADGLDRTKTIQKEGAGGARAPGMDHASCSSFEGSGVGTP